MRSTVIKFISDAQQRGELEKLDTSPSLKGCKLLDLDDEESPDKRWWRCWAGEAVVDVLSVNGEVRLRCV